MSAYIELGRLVAGEAKNVWAIYKQVKPAHEALAGVDKSLRMATSASDGVITANNDKLEEIRYRVAGMSEALNELAKNDENYWLFRSEGNWLQPATLGSAKTKLANWLSQFSTASEAIDAILPLAKGAAKVSETYVGSVINIALSGPTSLIEADTMALQEIETNLSLSKSNLDKICKRISAALKVFK